MLRRTKPVQRLQVSVWHLTDGHISDAVVRPAEQVHAAQGLQRLCLQFFNFAKSFIADEILGSEIEMLVIKGRILAVL